VTEVTAEVTVAEQRPSSACCLAISDWMPDRAIAIIFASCASSNT